MFVHVLYVYLSHVCTYPMYIVSVDRYIIDLPVIGVHEMHGRMHPNYWQIIMLLVVD